jgi:hypothetical protein
MALDRRRCVGALLASVAGVALPKDLCAPNLETSLPVLKARAIVGLQAMTYRRRRPWRSAGSDWTTAGKVWIATYVVKTSGRIDCTKKCFGVARGGSPESFSKRAPSTTC